MKKAAFVLICLLLAAIMAAAQSFRGDINGVVTDSTGASVSGAEVTATQEGTGLERKVQTDDDGNYTLPELPLGDYTVTITKQGFKTQTTKGVKVAVGLAPRVNAQLSPGEVKEAIEVTAEAPLVETTSNVMGGTISEQQMKELPINGRDYIKTLYMVSGSTGDPSGVTDSPGSFGLFSINGNRGRSNNYLLDGTDMN
ncbi:MAG TPA: carboxypeptidase-like regulatory domain-containing protein, partial [Terriglobales bacterium]|nr:carboxypeptidase-like regulatory domain-containing protein [Terriglobales bacterium]